MIIEKITYIYENELPKNPIMLPHAEALEYFERLMMNGNIITYVIDGELLGFIEFWRISYEQFGRLCCNITLAHDEDILTGEVCLITRMYINPNLRTGDLLIKLVTQFLEKNRDAENFTAFQPHKKHKSLQVFYREDWIKHLK